MSNPRCSGRFASSPTGLHFGSSITAIASHLQTRSQKGLWRVRIEDIDPPREVPEAASIALDNPLPGLIAALRFLNQDASLIDANRDEFRRWSIAHWGMDEVPKVGAKPYTPP